MIMLDEILPVSDETSGVQRKSVKTYENSERGVEKKPDDNDGCKCSTNPSYSQRLNDEQENQDGTSNTDNGAIGDVRLHNLKSCSL
jgi:hypothetical protein